MKRLLLIASLIFTLVACTKDPEITTGSIQGIVTESGSGTTPLSGVSVNIVANGMSTSTGSTGQFSFHDLEAKTYNLQFIKEGYITNTRSVTVIAGQEINCDMQLVAEKKEADIQISPSYLSFGTTQTQMSITITNEGKAETEWSLNLGNNNWLSAEPLSGRIASKKTQSIVFTVNRDKLPDVKSVVVNLSAFGNSYPISISCAPQNAKSEMTVEPTSLNFGTISTELAMTIRNVGDAALNWNIAGLTAECLSVSEASGTISSGGNKVVRVVLNRSNMPDILQTLFVVSDGIKEEKITVSATKEDMSAKMVVSPLTLNFEETSVELPLTIENKGKADLNWTVSGLSESCLSLSTTQGKITEGGKTIVKVTLNRATMPQTLNATFVISDGIKHETITVTGTKASGLAGLVVPQGLYVYYKFDEDFKDATENAIDGFGNNSPTFVTGVTSTSKAVKFSKTNNSAFVVSKPLVDSRKLTVCFWGKDFSDGNVFYATSSIRNEPMFTLSMSEGNLKFIATRSRNSYQYASVGTFMHPTLTDGNWHHVAIVSDFNETAYSKTTSTLYIDGQAVDTITEDGNAFSEATGSDQASYNTGLKFVMGGSVKISSSNTLGGTNMSVDNFRVYDTRKLSGSEIKSIYDSKQ